MKIDGGPPRDVDFDVSLKKNRRKTHQKSFCVAGAILLLHFQKKCCIFRGRRSTLDTSDVTLLGRRSTLDVSCCAFFANRIVSAAQSGDKVQIQWQAWHFVTGFDVSL